MNSTTHISSLAVYCGAKTGFHPTYEEQAFLLGKTLAEQDITLVYGGGNVGLMKSVADGCLSHNGKVIGVIPEKLRALELAHPKLTKLYDTHSMQERKFLMAQLSDAFIAMPGGFGTMEEMFEVLSLTQLGYHKKPVGILNVQNYYHHLKEWIVHAHNEGFINKNHAQMLIFEEKPCRLIEKLRTAPFFDLQTELTKD